MSAAPLDGRELLAGVTVPIITTVGPDHRPDPVALRPLLRAIAAAGISRIMLLGSNGEGPLIPTDLMGPFTRDVVDSWRSLDAGHRIVVNVSAPGTAEVLQRCEAVEAAAPDAVVASPPSYFRHRDDEVVAHYDALADLGRPVVIYNSPQRATPLTVAAAAEILARPHVIGIKDSSSDPELLRALVRIAGESTDAGKSVGVGQGDERLALAALRDGADGIVPGVANLAPVAAQRLVEAFRGGDNEGATAAQELLARLTGIHGIRPGVPTVKAILADRGLPATALMPPLIACTAAELSAIKELLAPDADQLVSLDRASEIPR